MGGQESVRLVESQMPSHTHQVTVNGATSGSEKPTNRFLGRVSDGTAYAGTSNGKTLNPGAIDRSGGSQPHENKPPYLALNYCIALGGIFPAAPE
jgi:microcystin-dependent protein